MTSGPHLLLSRGQRQHGTPTDNVGPPTNAVGGHTATPTDDVGAKDSEATPTNDFGATIGSPDR